MIIRSLTLDYTSLSLWRTCPQKFAYRILMQLDRAQTSSALEFGKLIHTGLELVSKYKALPYSGALDELEYLAAANQPRLDATEPLICVLNEVAVEAAKTSLFHVVPDERRSLRHLLLLLTRYVDRWNPDPLQTDITECKHKAYLGETRSGIQVFYSGTLDGFKDGKVIEHKTTSYMDAGFINRIHPNTQATGYVFLARDKFKDPKIDTVIFNALSTAGYGKSWGATTSRPDSWKINKDPTSLFMRAETHRSDEHLREWADNVLYDAERMAQDISRGHFSTYAPDPCTAFNSCCPYIDICRAAPVARGNLIDNTLETSLWDSFQINQDFVK